VGAGVGGEGETRWTYKRGMHGQWWCQFQAQQPGGAGGGVEEVIDATAVY
jgi:hypothetical protein